ncbi:MAG TPA: VOC family protein [Candidatus Kapabacteria bacterium]|nr:VOC family protein [Candidatus Kapabacteria bacterium]
MSYLFILVHGFQEMLTFYRDRLGLRTVYLEEGTCAFLALSNGGPQIALYTGREHVGSTGNHWFFAFDVNGIEAVVAELQRRGLSVGPIEDVPYGRAAKLRDPEGNVIELYESAE